MILPSWQRLLSRLAKTQSKSLTLPSLITSILLLYWYLLRSNLLHLNNDKTVLKLKTVPDEYAGLGLEMYHKLNQTFWEAHTEPRWLRELKKTPQPKAAIVCLFLLYLRSLLQALT